MTSDDPISRGTGTTESERYLAKLGDRTFLNLWSYPNVFIDKKADAKGDGKELCDLLVVCGDHVLVFSDKTIAWPRGDDINLAWRRWFSRAIKKSANQVRGAQRWLLEFPNRVFLDRGCTKPLPLPLPPTVRRKVHGIVVALGAGQACREFFGEGTGSLLVSPHIRGDEHVRDGAIPFTIGDLDPAGPFIHVFDDATLDVVMSELDTVTGLTSYLTTKEKLIRSTHLIDAAGEEDLVAYYMTHMSAAQEHDFTKPDGTAWANNQAFAIAPGEYAAFVRNEQYIAKKKADRDSYIWDRLIQAFTNNMLAGTTIVPDSGVFDLAQHEEGVRHMALVPRYLRRAYGRGIIDALHRGASVPRMTRAFLPGPTSNDPETAFFFMTLALPDMTLPGGYEQYRQVRRNILETYALSFLRKYPALKRIVGIAVEPPSSANQKTGSSEDLILAEQPAWSEDLLESLQERQEVFEIFRDGRYREYAMSGNEFPEVRPADSRHYERPALNRQQRRARDKKERRRK